MEAPQNHELARKLSLHGAENCQVLGGAPRWAHKIVPKVGPLPFFQVEDSRRGQLAAI